MIMERDIRNIPPTKKYAFTKSEVWRSFFSYTALILVPTELFFIMYHQLMKYGAGQEITWVFWAQAIAVNVIIITIMILIFHNMDKKDKVPYIVPGQPGDTYL